MAEPNNTHHAHHGHQAHHSGHGSPTFAQTNQVFWNSAADTLLEAQWARDLHAQIKDHMKANLAGIGIKPDEKSNEGKKMLDYACGEGFMSRFLSPYFSKCIGMDIAEGMTTRYNKVAREHGFPEERMYAIQGDLTSHGTPEVLMDKEYFDFDLVVISMALHHVENPQNIIDKLVERLKPGTGVLVVIDWEVKKDAHGYDVDEWTANSHPAQHTVAHAGFGKGQIEEMLMKAGCDEAVYMLFAAKSAIPMAKDGFQQLFLGKGKKAV